ncbi:hypothetical protein NC651_010532 [Populus alba x Populus x berolinensis]|nr:hypothetical protein NC651_010532 [Populus alba x Populus x berolinensis]
MHEPRCRLLQLRRVMAVAVSFLGSTVTSLASNESRPVEGKRNLTTTLRVNFVLAVMGCCKSE